MKKIKNRTQDDFLNFAAPIAPAAVIIAAITAVHWKTELSCSGSGFAGTMSSSGTISGQPSVS